MSDDGLRGFMRDVNKTGDLDTRDMKKKGATKSAGAAPNLQDQSLRGYLQKLERAGEMIRVEKEVDPATNLAAIECASSVRSSWRNGVMTAAKSGIPRCWLGRLTSYW